MPDTTDDFRVFAYGSLMWRPGFTYIDAYPALIYGYHRDFCVYSHHYRGTPENPGLVLGLARGGSCRGLVFRVAAADKENVKAYLDERELVTYAYQPRVLLAHSADGAASVYTFVADPEHPQFAGHLQIEQAAAIIMEAEGCAGLNRDYLINTVRHLEKEGFTDRRMHRLLRRVEHLTGIIEAGSGI
ncbi:MAG: gamma-glutamylcyclotransferase [Rhodospirillales bacterium]|nr:gamma-glutamylcyclotransferase [Rhodospirillales bacterium]